MVEGSAAAMKIPPFDPQLETALEMVEANRPYGSHITFDHIPAMRTQSVTAPIDDVLAAHPDVVHQVRTISGYEGAEIVISIFARKDSGTNRPGIYFIHGGGMIIGNRFTAVDQLIRWVDIHDAVGVSVEYRLAPEFPDPVPVEDCYAGLLWFAEHVSDLGVDPASIIITGASAGGGLAAGVALLARDRNGPALKGQLLQYPMLDDRNESVSAQQFEVRGVWTRWSNETGWTALLGDRRGTEAVSIYAAPGRATDLSGLPPTFVDVGSAEVFRDEDVAYANRIWAAGGAAELHVWPGAFHASDVLVPSADISAEAIRARDVWLARQLTR